MTFLKTDLQSSPMWTASSHCEPEAVHPGENVGGGGWWAQGEAQWISKGQSSCSLTAEGSRNQSSVFFNSKRKYRKFSCHSNCPICVSLGGSLTPWWAALGALFLTQVKIFVPYSNPMLRGHIGHHDQVIGGSDLVPWPQAHEECWIVLLIALPVCE